MNRLLADPTTATLALSDLVVELGSHRGPLFPVRGVSLVVRKGERMGLVGESGSGKSMTALAVMKLLPPGGRISGGRVVVGGRDITELRQRQMAAVRGSDVAMIYQDPMSSLNPTKTVGDQIDEAILAHRRLSARSARRTTIELLDEVGIANAALRYSSHPHELSGGLRQRVMIAMAISCDPTLLIADEPTTALDVTTQARVMDLLQRLSEERGMSVVLITHNLALASSFCDSVAVMYAGRIVERGTVPAIMDQPAHPYTEALIRSICRMDQDPKVRIAAIAGQPPVLAELPGGCAFHPRCLYAEERCALSSPPTEELGPGQSAECFVAGKLLGK